MARRWPGARSQDQPGEAQASGWAGPQQAAQGGAGPGHGLAFTRNLWSPATCCRGVPAPMRPGTRCLSQHHELPDENAGSRQGRDQTPATDPRPARPTAPGACPRPCGVNAVCESSRATRSRNARAKNVFRACLGRRRAPGRGPHLAHLRAACRLLSGPERHDRARADVTLSAAGPRDPWSPKRPSPRLRGRRGRPSGPGLRIPVAQTLPGPPGSSARGPGRCCGLRDGGTWLAVGPAVWRGTAAAPGFSEAWTLGRGSGARLSTPWSQ